MLTIPNWRGQSIKVASSKGGTLAVVNPKDNLITSGITLWPPPEIVQKLYQSRHEDAFAETDLEAVKSALGFYSDLQSLNSEDAITWSVFGTLAYADNSTKCAFVTALFDLLSIPISPVADANIWLWRRIPHPQTLDSGGPEIDFGIETEQAILFGEAKWLSGVGQAQGKTGEKDQISLRREFFEKYGKAIFGSLSHYIVFVVSLYGNVLKANDVNLGDATLHFRDATWDSICNITSHPAHDELVRYLEWKKRNSKKAG